LFGVVAPLAITGASIASSEPVHAGGDNTQRFVVKRMAAFAVRHLTRPVGGVRCGKSENKNTQHDKGLAAKKGSLTKSHPVFVEVNASHFHHCA
jgi:hypothetical protein